MLGYSLGELRPQSLLELFTTKLGYKVEDFNEDALDTLNRITVPPGLTDKLPDNILEKPSPCEDYTPCDIAE